MKKNILKTAAFATMIGIAAGCSQELPYPLDEVTRTATVDVSKTPGSAGYITANLADENNRNISVRLQIPAVGAYDYQKVQLVAVYKDADTVLTAVMRDDIQLKVDEPQDFALTLEQVITAVGKTAPALGDELNFTANVVATNGKVVRGYIEELKLYSGTTITGWEVNGRGYSCRTAYMAQCQFNYDDYEGTFHMNETSSFGNDSYDVTLTHISDLPDPLPAGVNPAALRGIRIDPVSPNIWEPVITTLDFWINEEDLSLVVPNQSTGDYYSTGDEIWWNGVQNTSFSTCSKTIKFSLRPWMPTYGGSGTGWSYISFTLTP